MKIAKIFNTKTLFAALFAFVMAGCTNLDEQVLDEVLGDDASDPAGALAAAYDRLGDGTFTSTGGMFAMNEMASDIALLPTRGSDWGDGGKWRAMHEFTWAPDNAIVNDNWDRLTNGITRSLTAVATINASDAEQKTLMLAEAKGLLAFYMYHTIDLFGQTPYRDPLNLSAPVEFIPAGEAIDQLILDVEAIIPDLANSGEQNTHNGRFTKQAAYSLLASMYLNRAVYKDRYGSSFNFSEAAVSGSGTDMDRVIYYTSLIIDSGDYSLESNYFKNFDIDNSGAPELVWAITQEIDYNQHNGSNDLAYNTMERNQKCSPTNRGTNASCITPEFYATWEGNHNDPRFHRHYQYTDGTWFMNDGTDVSVPATSIVPGTSLPWFHFNRGLQEGLQHGPKLLSSASFEMVGDRIKVSPLVCEKSTTTPMDFTPALDFDNPTQAVHAQNQINRGVRCFKFEFDPEDGNGSGKVDIPLFRLGGIYTMRAEAYLRKGDAGNALADINILRTSRTRESLYGNAAGTALTAIDMDVLFREIAFELYWEMWRRPQMVRFGKLEAAQPGSAKPATQPFRRIFPIPQKVMDVTPGVTQNQGY
ncbi:glycan metabolism protein RagB [Flavobacterium akiainvivens]|uniref:Glycan metabolism protein RagB n=1 Tax=Flavobacterium akiainvivens TaxID=1202724 RepID=A0A0M8MAA3_9FLAO|nr:RagB/SusD family nutrient uptake outer membrane protein [Flavobacterium akiainvivens]KOS05865.1 glycan metabolism protein RagB [Flavobacterium akiainvivens]SFQ56585.1 Starch-binding associating with outer membrane [Flavobacterium akiainvivens]